MEGIEIIIRLKRPLSYSNGVSIEIEQAFEQLYNSFHLCPDVVEIPRSEYESLSQLITHSLRPEPIEAKRLQVTLIDGLAKPL